MINWTQVSALRDEVGPEDFDEVVTLFLEEVQEVIDELPSVGNADMESKMHFLKGSALNLGFTDFSDLCAAGEKMAASGQSDAVDVAGVVSSYDASRAHFLGELGARFAG